MGTRDHRAARSLLREKPRPRELRDTARSPGQRGRAGPQARVCGARSLRPPGPGWADATQGKVCWSPTSCVPCLARDSLLPCLVGADSHSRCSRFRGFLLGASGARCWL